MSNRTTRLPRTGRRLPPIAWQTALALGLVATLLTTTSPPARANADVVEIEVRSNRADLVSGEDALIEVRLPAGTDPADLRVDVDGRDVTEAFAVRDDGHLAGVVDGLALGRNRVRATLPDGSGAQLDLTSHPIGGPIFSGPQIQPWYCLPDALDEQCNRPTEISYQYMSSVTGGFRSYDPDAPPADVATTTTDEGEEVPYVVRIETGNMGRSQYRIAVLTTPDEEWTRWTGPVGWNHKVYVPHGAGCGMGHSEGAAPDVMLDIALSRGFAVMSTALEHNTENCNVVVQAESVMMAKERLIEAYGDIRYMMGVGCSGGSIAQLHMANAYPGLYDGLTVSCTYPDIPSLDLLDCPALLRYFTDPTRWSPGVAWTERHMAEAAGLQSFSVCISWLETFSPMFDPTRGVECDVPAQEPERVYDPETNPTGVRCSFQDYLVNLYGTRQPERWGPVEQAIGQGFAGRPYDNVGMQYGLRALQEGLITSAQFVDLNASVGAVGIDYETQAERIEADPAALVTAHRAGVHNMGHELDRVPIIDMPVPADRYEFHDNYKSWALRQRLLNANGHADNHVIWYGPDEQGLDFADGTRAFETMDAWLTAVEVDDRDVSLEQKVADNRPDGAEDRCDVPTEGICDLIFGSAGNIRWAAGAPTLANDVIKCELKPLRRNDYVPVHFTDAEWARLEMAFPSGVCDWTRPGVAQQPAVAWQTYADGPGGRPLGQPPRSVAFGPGGPDVVRFGGVDRIDTAVAIASADLEAAETIVLAGAGSFADALAGAPLAAALHAPLLLTSSDRLAPVVAQEIRRLGTTEVVLLGGAAALGGRIEEDLTALGVATRRLAGPDRYTTAAAIAADLAPAGVVEVLVVGGDTFPDAVAASAMGAALRMPVLLTQPGRLPEATADALEGARSAMLVGGTEAISADVVAAVDALVGDVTRLAGANRYATAASVAEAAMAGGASPTVTWVATGTDHADALVAGAAAGRDRGLLVLVAGTDPGGSPEARGFIAAHRDAIAQIRIAGDTAAVAPSVAADLRGLLR